MIRSLFPVLFFLAAPAWASDSNLSGQYVDVDGGPVVISQSGKSVSVSPNMKDMPEQARQFLGEIKLAGTVETRSESRFAMKASYKKTVEPTTSMKLKMNVEFAAEGQQTTEGLIMTSCEWTAHMIVFANGEIAGSENHSEKCVGLWKRK